MNWYQYSFAPQQGGNTPVQSPPPQQPSRSPQKIPYRPPGSEEAPQTKPRFSDVALRVNIGKKVIVYTNYIGQNPINQNISYEGILKDVGTDYIMVAYQGKNRKPHTLFMYTVNIARLEFEGETIIPVQ